MRATRGAAYVRAAFVGAGAVAHERPAPRPTIDLRAIREALLALADPTAFARSSCSQLAALADVPSGDAAARATRFREIVERELLQMATTGRGARQRAAIAATYLRLPGANPSQEQIAEALGVPFRTYRDHLTQGLAELVRRLGGR